MEAKNDNPRSGFGQCKAEMVAAQQFNEKAETTVGAVYGVVTTGSAWKFLQLQSSEVTVDVHEYYIVDIGNVMAILAQMVRGAKD